MFSKTIIVRKRVDGLYTRQLSFYKQVKEGREALFLKNYGLDVKHM